MRSVQTFKNLKRLGLAVLFSITISNTRGPSLLSIRQNPSLPRRADSFGLATHCHRLLPNLRSIFFTRSHHLAEKTHNIHRGDMFRAGKPSVSRPIRDKTNTNPPETRSPTQNAVVPRISPAEPAQPKEFVPQPFQQAPHKSLPPLQRPPPLPLEDDTMPDNVSPWDKTLHCKPFFGELPQEENLIRDVREDRRITLGNDPLIDDILKLFPNDDDNK